MKKIIGSAYDEAPFYYAGAQHLNVLFRTDPEVLERVLPPVLKPLGSRSLAMARVSSPARSHFGNYVSSYIFVPALLGDQKVIHMVTGMKTTFSGVVGGRETWGMPLQLGQIQLELDGDTMRVEAGRNGISFMKLVARLERNVPQSETSSPPMSTYEVRRRPWENATTENLLIAIQGEGGEHAEGRTMVEHWEGSAVLSFPGGVPGDDWSIFSVREVLSVNYSVSTGRSVLGPGTVVAEW